METGRERKREGNRKMNERDKMWWWSFDAMSLKGPKQTAELHSIQTLAFVMSCVCVCL